MTQRRALITGGAGFIGSTVADALLADGWSVTVLDNLASGKRENIPAAATFVEADIRSPDAAACIREGAFDVVCHLAAQIDVRRSVTDPAYDVDVNIGGSVNLMQAVHASGRRTRFIFASTGGAVYGDFVQPPNLEDYPKDPESPYGIAKFAAELYLAYYARIHGLDYVALRFANVYGPRQDPHGEAGVVAIFTERILAGQPVRVFARRTEGDEGCVRDYTYVGDVVRALVPAGKTRDALLEAVDEAAGEGDFIVMDYAGRLGDSDNWGRRLSPGEQQRLGFARALLHRPDWLFLDEATSALDSDMERELYDRLFSELAGTTVVSIAHREQVAEHHLQQWRFEAGQSGTKVSVSALAPEPA